MSNTEKSDVGKIQLSDEEMSDVTGGTEFTQSPETGRYYVTYADGSHVCCFGCTGSPLYALSARMESEGGTTYLVYEKSFCDHCKGRNSGQMTYLWIKVPLDAKRSDSVFGWSKIKRGPGWPYERSGNARLTWHD